MKDKRNMVIRPHEKLWHVDLGEIWQYRDLVLLFFKRNVIVEYKQTLLGPLWHLIQSILTILTYMVVFGGIAKMSTDGLPQALFYLAGIICWLFFSNCLSQTSTTFTSNLNVFEKVYFPRIVVPIAKVLSSLMRFGIQLCLFVVLYLYFWFAGSDIQPTWAVLLLPVLVVMMAGLGLGLGLLISSITAKYRDLSFSFSFIVRLWMFATPIVYPLSMVQESKFRMLIMANPMTSIIEAFKYATLGQGYFSWYALSYSFAFVCVILVLGVMLFNKVQRSFIDTV